MMRRRAIRRGGPGVVGTVARTAVVAGTATAVSHRVSGRMTAREQETQQAEMADQAAMQTQADIEEMRQQMEVMQAQQAQAAVSPVTGAGTDVIARLQQLAEMKNAGLLSDAEFEAAKARVLGS